MTMDISVQHEDKNTVRLVIKRNGEPVPLMFLVIKVHTNGIELTLETPDATEPNLVFERFHDSRTDEHKSTLTYRLADEYERLSVLVLDSEGRSLLMRHITEAS